VAEELKGAHWQADDDEVPMMMTMMMIPIFMIMNDDQWFF
jgi:hypothetical protein